MVASRLRVLFLIDVEAEFDRLSASLRRISEKYECHWFQHFGLPDVALCSGPWDVLILESVVSGRDMLQWAGAAFASSKPIPFIIISESENRELDLKAQAVGAGGFLTRGELTGATLERAMRYAMAARQTGTDLGAIHMSPAPAGTVLPHAANFLPVADGGFLQAMLNAMDSRVMVLDLKGTVVALTRGRMTGNGDRDPLLVGCELGCQYLTYCQSVALTCGTGRATALALSQLLAGKRQYYRVSYSAPGTKGVEWFQLSASRFLDRGKTWIVVSHHDITNQRQAESERDLFFTISLDLLCITDKAGYFRRLNPAFSATLGYTAAELLHQPYLDFIHPDDVEATKRLTEENWRGNPIHNFVNRYRCKDGTYQWLAWTSSTENNLTYAVARDITEIKGAESRLERSLSLMQATLEATADGILVLDEEGNIADYNEKFLSMWGISDQFVKEHADQKPVVDHMRSQLERPEALMFVPVASRPGASARGFDILRFLDGRTLERYSQVQVLGGQEVGRVWSFRDISERKWAEAMQTRLTSQLQKERQRLKDTLANLPGIVWESWLPVAGSQGDVQVGYVSDYVRTMLGYSVQDWLTIPNFWASLVHPEDAAQAEEESAVIMKGEGAGAGGVLRYRMRTVAGEYIWVETHIALVKDGDGEVIGLRGVSMDVSDRMQAQETQTRLVSLLEATTDLVAWTDPSLQLRYVNRAGRKMLGIGEHQPIHTLALADFAAGWARELLANVGVPTAVSAGVWSGETALLGPGGEIPVSQVVMAHRDFDGEVQFFSTIARDVTERRRAEEELLRAKDELEVRVIERTAELERANREYLLARDDADAANKAKSEFLSRMSHELRTPLNAILGFGQILEMQELDARDMEAVDQILVAGRHLLNLINEVLDIARIEAGRLSLSPETIMVGPAIKGVLDLLKPVAAASKVTLQDHSLARQDPRSGALVDWELFADRQRLHQVLLNLLSNAIKYNHPGGLVTVSCEEVTGPLPRLRINVSDTGVGIRPENMKKLFVPFERLGAEGTGVEGTGIGLVLARRLSEAMGGFIGVNSVLGEGSNFWVELPLVTMAPTAAPSPHAKRNLPLPSAALGSLGRVAKVLCIEDNVSNLALLKKLFADAQEIELHSAMLGREGLAMAKEIMPDLVLLDLHLPDMLGEEVLLALKAENSTNEIPVIAVSADGTAGQISRILAAGAANYLTKPLDIGHFFKVVTEVLSKHA